jgi:hypothetical protein
MCGGINLCCTVLMIMAIHIQILDTTDGFITFLTTEIGKTFDSRLMEDLKRTVLGAGAMKYLL